MKVIFLDIDGVLCTMRSHLAHHGRGGMWNDWDEVACAVLKRVCDKNIKLVISSTWRMGMDTPYMRNDGKESRLSENLYKHDLMRHIYLKCWRTNVLPWTPRKCRGDEIKDFLTRHPEVTDYRILDDDCDMLEEQKEKFIHTNGLDGMTHRNIIDLYEWAGLMHTPTEHDYSI